MISEISRVEVIGYHSLKEGEEKFFKDIFEYVSVVLPDQNVFAVLIYMISKTGTDKALGTWIFNF